MENPSVILQFVKEKQSNGRDMYIFSHSVLREVDCERKLARRCNPVHNGSHLVETNHLLFIGPWQNGHRMSSSCAGSWTPTSWRTWLTSVAWWRPGLCPPPSSTPTWSPPPPTRPCEALGDRAHIQLQLLQLQWHCACLGANKMEKMTV